MDGELAAEVLRGRMGAVESKSSRACPARRLRPVTRQPEPWVEKAEKLVHQVGRLLDDRKRIKKALAKKHGEDFAEDLLQQLEQLCKALEFEVFRVKREGSRRRAGWIAQMVRGVALVVATAVVDDEVQAEWRELRGTEQAADELLVACGMTFEVDLHVDSTAHSHSAETVNIEDDVNAEQRGGTPIGGAPIGSTTLGGGGRRRREPDEAGEPPVPGPETFPSPTTFPGGGQEAPAPEGIGAPMIGEDALGEGQTDPDLKR
jgi:hypothetical protein